MQLLNILIVSDGVSKTLAPVKKSKYLNKLYAAEALEGAVEIKFNTFQELAEKCKALKIDIVIVENEKWILQGIADVLRKNFVNCMGLTARANNLVLSNEYARKLFDKYRILIPKKLSYPSAYPVAVKADGICEIGNSLNEIIDIRNKIANQSEEIARNVYLEEYIQGESLNLISLFDGKNLLSFTSNDLILEYSNKLQNLLVSEKMEFIGFLTSKLIIAGSRVYNVGISSDLSDLNINLDLIYLLNSAIYQKLNEIKL